jgi:hypothetical protein
MRYAGQVLPLETSPVDRTNSLAAVITGRIVEALLSERDHVFRTYSYLSMAEMQTR